MSKDYRPDGCASSFLLSKYSVRTDCSRAESAPGSVELPALQSGQSPHPQPAPIPPQHWDLSQTAELCVFCPRFKKILPHTSGAHWECRFTEPPGGPTAPNKLRSFGFPELWGITGLWTQSLFSSLTGPGSAFSFHKGNRLSLKSSPPEVLLWIFFSPQDLFILERE